MLYGNYSTLYVNASNMYFICQAQILFSFLFLYIFFLYLGLQYKYSLSFIGAFLIYCNWWFINWWLSLFWSVALLHWSAVGQLVGKWLQSPLSFYYLALSHIAKGSALSICIILIAWIKKANKHFVTSMACLFRIINNI